MLVNKADMLCINKSSRPLSLASLVLLNMLCINKSFDQLEQQLQIIRRQRAEEQVPFLSFSGFGVRLRGVREQICVVTRRLARL